MSVLDVDAPRRTTTAVPGNALVAAARRVAVSDRSPVAASLLLSAVFVAKSVFEVGGVRYLTLFDDAMVSMRYARNLAAGHGLVWNAGEAPVEGYTNLLWTLVLALFHWLPLPENLASLPATLFGAAVLAVLAVVAGALARELAPGDHPVRLAAMWFVALNYPLVYWTLRGMEVGLLALLLAAATVSALRFASGRRPGAHLAALAGLSALAVLTRTDALVGCGLVGAFAVWRAPSGWRLRAVVVLGLAIGGTLAAHTAFRLLYYGYPLPNTYYLKVEGIGLIDRLRRGALSALNVSLVQLYPWFALVLGGMIVRRGRLPAAEWLLAALFAGQCAYSVYVGGDAWEWMAYANRYLAVTLPAFGVLVVLALRATLVTDLRARWRVAGAALALFPVGWMLTAALVDWTGLEALRPCLRLDEALMRGVCAGYIGTLNGLPLALCLFAGWAVLGQRTLRAEHLPMAFAGLAVAAVVAVNALPVGTWLARGAAHLADDALTVRYALALREATPPSARIAVVWAGAIPYFADRPVVDLLGKSDAVVALGPPPPGVPFYPGHNKWNYAYSVGQLRPEVVAQLWAPTDRDLADLAAWGYVEIAETVWVRADAAGVDRVRLAALDSDIRDHQAIVRGSGVVPALDVTR